MAKITRFAVSLDENLLNDFDELIHQNGYSSRSEAIRDLIRNKLITQDWDQKEETIGTITLVYNHHQTDLSNDLTQHQHDYHGLIVSSLHVHLDYDNCLEVIVVKGAGKTIQDLASRMISRKGVKHGKLTLTTTGKEIS